MLLSLIPRHRDHLEGDAVTATRQGDWVQDALGKEQYDDTSPSHEHRGTVRKRILLFPVKELDSPVAVEKGYKDASRGPTSPALQPMEDGFLSGLAPALTLAQMFFLLPVSMPSQVKHAKFRWKSPRTILALVVIILAIWKSSYSIIRMVQSGVKYNTSVNAVFFTVTITAQFMFLRVGSAWRGLATDVGRVEAIFLRMYGPPRKLRSRMQLVTTLGIVMAVVEHAMAIAGILAYTWPCYQQGGIGLLWQAYFITKYRKTFTTHTFTAWKGILVLFLQFVSQFVWSFLDLFVALFAMGLSEHFQQINDELEDQLDEIKVHNEQFWREKRAHYNILAELVRHVDNVIGPLILVTYASDLYCICLQTLAIVKPVNTSVLARVYAVFSLLYIILRTTFMTASAANINEQSKRPKDVLYYLPSTSYSLEVDRFLTQVVTDRIAFSGCSFFTISRSFYLTVAGTIFTYIVVLIQFNSSHDDITDSGSSNITVSCTCHDLKLNNPRYAHLNC